MREKEKTAAKFQTVSLFLNSRLLGVFIIFEYLLSTKFLVLGIA